MKRVAAGFVLLVLTAGPATHAGGPPAQPAAAPTPATSVPVLPQPEFPADWGEAQRATAAALERRSYYDASEHRKLFAITSFFETSGFAGYGKVTGDFDCQGVTLGAVQRVISDESARNLFALVDHAKLDALIIQHMPAHGKKFKRALLTADPAERLALVRQWQTPPISEGECAGGRKSRKVAFIEDPSELPADDPAQASYGKIADELSALLSSPELVEAQRRNTISDALCARFLASLWATRMAGGAKSTATVAAVERGHREAVCAKLPRNLEGLATPQLRDVALFYDMRFQPGVVGVPALQDAAMSIRRGSLGGDRLENAFYFLTQAQRLDWHEPAGSQRFARTQDASGDGKVNGEMWQKRYAAKCYDEGQMRLATLIFAKVGESVSAFFRSVANRKLTVLLGEGCVNGSYVDLRDIYSGKAAVPRTVGECKKQWFNAQCTPEVPR